MTAPRLTQGIAPDAGWIARQIQDHQRQITELRAAQTLNAATVGSGGITLTDSGAVTTRDTDGTLIASMGGLPAAFNRADGSTQPGFAVYREDGSLAAALADLNPGVPPYKQAFQILDRTQTVVLSEDANSGQGLAVPHVTQSPLVNTNITTWPATTAGTWTSIAAGYVERQHPGLAWAMQLEADASTSGQFRLTLDGVTIATSPTVVGGGGGSFSLWQSTYYYPAGWTSYSLAAVSLDAQVTAGTGSARAAVYFLSGAESP